MVKRLETDVVVIGGGATGCGVVRDVAMRGWRAVLIDRVDLAQGTTGRFHGLLHSGGRYVKSDPHSATECAEENAILRKVMPHTIEDTGGMFVVAPEDEESYAAEFLQNAAKTGVPASEISVAEALRREPRLNPGTKRAFLVQDGTIDGWALCWSAARSAQEYGAKILTYHWVTSIETRDGKVVAVHAQDNKNGGEEVIIDCNFVLNCAGAWAGEIAGMAGCPGVEVVPGAGIMIAMNHRLTQHVLNRCIYPSDGDILVPAHPVCIIGTTDHVVEHPDKCDISSAEVQQMLDSGEALIPGFRQARALHAWAGARPLVKDTRVSASDSRHMSRGMSIIDHTDRDGVSGLLTIAGGKLTTFRLMAERTVDAMCEQLGDHRVCRTADEAVPGQKDGRLHKITDRLRDREAGWGKEQIICECELVSKKMVEDALEVQPTASMDDLRRQLRVGMGPCQGGFCSARVAGIANDVGAADAERATGMISLFMKNRWIGLWPILYGQQLRESVMDDWIMQGIYDIEHAPQAESFLREVELNPVETAKNERIDKDYADFATGQPTDNQGAEEAK